MNFNTGQWTVIGLSFFLFIWYFAANSLNRRRGIAIYRWLHRGMEEIGKISVAQWIGSSNMGAHLLVKKAAKPFRHVEARYLLEPREFLPYWLFTRLKGKRDEVVIQITLRSTPKVNFEINNWKIRNPTKKSITGNPISQGSQDAQVNPEEAHIKTLLEKFFIEYGSTVEKMIFQHEAPHLIIYTRIKSLLRSPAELYFRTLLSLFQES